MDLITKIAGLITALIVLITTLYDAQESHSKARGRHFVAKDMKKGRHFRQK